MKITVLSVGKIRDDRLRSLVEEYRGRLSHHLPLDEVEVKKVKKSDPRQVMAEEAEALLGATPEGALRIALTERGKTRTSEEVAEELESWMLAGRQHVVFYIGGAHGLDRAFLKACDRRWSLSPMTFPHDVARMLLWEQLYRGMSILRGEPYHK